MSAAEVPSINPKFEKDGILLEENKRKDLLAHVDKLYSEARQSRLRFERQWYTNLAFYFGKQWSVWQPGVNNELTRLYNPPAPPWRVRMVSNKIRPIIRKELAKLTKEKPTVFVMPASTDDDDILAARAGENFTEHQWRAVQMQRVLRRTIFWMLICGSSFTKDWYDPRKLDGDGNEGKIGCEPVSPFHLYIGDIDEEELENQPFVIHTLAKDPDWVRSVYNENVQPDASSPGGLLEQKFLSAIGAGDSSKSKRFVLVKEIWIKPNARFPDGAVITWANQKILSVVEAWPYDHEEYPFTKIDHVPTGRFYGESVIVDLIPLQKEYNRTRSQIIEAKNRMSKPQLLAARGSIDPKKITSEPGLVIQYTPGFNPPSPLPLQNIPSYVLQEIDRNQVDMNDISSQHEVTKGQTPPGVEAATAIAFLQEQDDSALSHTVSSIEEAVEKIGRHFLTYVQQFWELPRLIRYLGPNNQLEAFELSKSVLKGNVDLRVEAGSATPRSRAAKQAFIMELGKIGWITPERALRYLEMTETSRLYEEAQIDTRQAQRENLMLAQGMPVQPNTWDNHETHINEHNNYRKRQEYMSLPDEAKILFEQHVQMHSMVAQQQIMQQMQTGVAMPGQGEAQSEEPPPMPGGQ